MKEVKTVKKNSQVNLVTNKLKEFEKQIVEFYELIGEKQALNEKYTIIFAYFQLYQSLTQDQIKQLTGFSLSTISTTLQTFLQTEILVKELLPHSRTSIYQLRRGKVSFIYIIFSHIVEEQMERDAELILIHSELQLLQNKYPQMCNFLGKRINSLRNYFEAQRRAINGKETFDFFEEDISNSISDNIDFDLPLEIREIEEKFVEFITINGFFFGNDFIKNNLIGYFVTRGKVTQQLLEKLTGYSRSTVSRNLQYFLEMGRVKIEQRKYRKPLVYYYESVSLDLIKNILQTDDFIFSWIPKFNKILQELRSNSEYQKNKEGNEFLQNRIIALVKEIELFKTGSKLLEKTQSELKSFIEQ